MTVSAPYRIGWTTNKRWWHPHRPWQAEADGVRFARRGLTPRAAERKMTRDATLSGATPHQRFRAWRANVLGPWVCSVVGHRPYRLVVGPRSHVLSAQTWCRRCLRRSRGGRPVTAYRVRFQTTIEVTVDLDAPDEDTAADDAWQYAEDYLTDTLVVDDSGEARVLAAASLDGIGADGDAVEEIQ